MANNDTVTLKVVTPDGIALETEIEFARFPGKSGELGIYPNHSATLSELKEGFITLTKDSGQKEFYFIKKGYAHIRPEEVLLITPFIEKQDEIDKERAEKSLKRASERLTDSQNNQDIDSERARQSKLRASERLHTLSLN